MSETHELGDLIDLHVSSPVLPRSQISQACTELSDNLIDTELPILAKKLQSASQQQTSIADSRRTSVDIEDILITIDDDDDYDEDDGEDDVVDAPTISKAISDRFFDVCDNNVEALNVLKSLDDVLNASLLESDDILNVSEDSKAQQDIEDCLQDLDNYLKAQDSTCSISSCEDLSTSFTSNSNDETSGPSSAYQEDSTAYEESLRKKLRQIEENYAKFLASSGCINRGYVDTEFLDERRPMSACEWESGIERKRRKRNDRATTVAVVRRERPSIRTSLMGNRRTRCATNAHAFKATINTIDNNNSNLRTSGSQTSVESDSEDIDWSWVQEVVAPPQTTTTTTSTVTAVATAAENLELERSAHAPNDRCTGTVVVEANRGRCQATSRSEPAMLHEEAKVEATTEEAATVGSGTWLRDSMRRLRRLRLPIAGAHDAEADDTSATMDTVSGTTSDQVQLTAPPDVVQITSSTRPLSAPSRLLPRTPPIRSSRSRSRSEVSHEPGGRARSSSASSRSRRARSLSSSETSIPSSVDSTPSGNTAISPTQENVNHPNNAAGNHRRSCDRNRQSDMPEAESPLGHWPHSLSSMMACLGCTLGLFNISRFAMLTVHFGLNFIFQFLFLTMVFGLPLFTLQLCLGQQLGAGVIDMWRISPLFQGVGVSLLIAHALMGLYSIIGVSWMFVFFRDSFITKLDQYRWAEPYEHYRRELTSPNNGTGFKLSETIPDYFNGIVLQRNHLSSEQGFSTIKFQLAFNLAVVWMIVFVSLSKGLRSYGKVVYAFTLLPVFGTFILCAKVLGLMPPEFVNVIFPETNWGEFFVNPKSWLAAGQETFLTWGLLGAAIMQIASHNKHKHLLQRDSSLVAVITITILLLVAFLANTCVQILKSYGYSYVPSSFERMTTFTFLRSSKDSLPPNLANVPIRQMTHQSFIVGDRVIRPNVDITRESGYQVLRLATELVPAVLAVMGSDQVSPFWAVLFYFILIMFGIAQQLAIWHCVITGIMAIKAKVLKSWETTITFFSCACGFILGLPMATELGIYVVYFFDYTIGGIWWLLIVILLQIMAVFMVRGRPYSGDTVVTALFYPNTQPCFLSWAPALLSFTWNVILPVALMVLCIATFKNNSFRDMFIWHHAPMAEYWPLWARQLGSMLQLLPILCIPLVAVIQSYRYLNNGPSDILDRIQLLYRPPIGEHMDELAVQEAQAAIRNNNEANSTVTEDPPPKYTPPPSYTTATGARLAKFLRQSIRRSVRRIASVLGESSSSRQRATIAQSQGQSQLQPPPPDYNAVLVEMNTTHLGNDVSITIPDGPSNVRISTLERLRNLETTSTALTAAEVASILRSSFRRSTIRNGSNIRNVNFNDASLSERNLVDSAAPIGETSLVMENLPSDVGNKIDNNASVI